MWLAGAYSSSLSSSVFRLLVFVFSSSTFLSHFLTLLIHDSHLLFLLLPSPKPSCPTPYHCDCLCDRSSVCLLRPVLSYPHHSQPLLSPNPPSSPFATPLVIPISLCLTCLLFIVPERDSYRPLHSKNWPLSKRNSAWSLRRLLTRFYRTCNCRSRCPFLRPRCASHRFLFSCLYTSYTTALFGKVQLYRDDQVALTSQSWRICMRWALAPGSQTQLRVGLPRRSSRRSKRAIRLNSFLLWKMERYGFTCS